MATLAATGRKAFTLALSFFVFPKPFTAGTIRLKIDGNKLIKIVGESQSCMVSKLPIIFKRTRKYVPSVVCVLARCLAGN